jgi:hypothetical protein
MDDKCNCDDSNGEQKFKVGFNTDSGCLSLMEKHWSLLRIRHKVFCGTGPHIEPATHIIIIIAR